MDKKHIRIKTFEPQEDGSVKATTESYFESLASVKEEIVKQITTSQDKLLADLISCLDVIHKQEVRDKLTLVIHVDDWNKPNRIEKQYTTKKESYNKR